MNDQLESLRRLQAQLGEQEPTAENVLEASIVLTRNWVYEEYYYAKPDVVEALLLQYRNFMEILFSEIDNMYNVSEEEELQIMKNVLRYSQAMKKTIEQLYSV